jgi:WD40 repeat protein
MEMEAVAGGPTPVEEIQSAPVYPASGIMVVSGTLEGLTRTVQIWDGLGDCDNPLWTESFIGHVWYITYSPLANRIVILSHWKENFVIRAWDLNTNQRLYCVQDEHLYDAEISINAAGTKLISTASRAPGIIIWDAETGTKLLILLMTSCYRVAAFTMDSPDGQVVTLHASGKIQLWDAENGAELRAFSAYDDTLIDFQIVGVTVLAVSSEGPLVAAALKNGVGNVSVTLDVWNYSTGEQIFHANDDRYGRILLGVDNNTVMYLTDEDITVWNISSSSIRYRIVDHFSSRTAFVTGSNSVVVVKFRQLAQDVVCRVDLITGEISELRESPIRVEWIFCVRDTNILL